MKKLALGFWLLTTICYSQTEFDLNVLKLVNTYRIENSLCPFTWDTIMFKVAVNQSNYMSSTGHLNHNQLKMDSTKFKVAPNFGTKFTSQGVNFNCTVYENCGVVFNTDKLSNDAIAKDIVEAWKKSPAHNKLLLNSIMTNVGVSHLIGYTYEDFSYNELGDEFVETIACEMEWVSLDGYGIRE
jgi:uncharacterized protein YkwD